MCKFYRIASKGLQATSIQIVHEPFDCPSYIKIWNEWTQFFLDGAYISVKFLRTRPISRVCVLNSLYRFVYILKKNNLLALWVYYNARQI